MAATPKMRGQDMNAIAEVNILPQDSAPRSCLPTQRGHIPCSVPVQNLRFQMLVDSGRRRRSAAASQLARRPLNAAPGSR